MHAAAQAGSERSARHPSRASRPRFRPGEDVCVEEPGDEFEAWLGPRRPPSSRQNRAEDGTRARASTAGVLGGCALSRLLDLRGLLSALGGLRPELLGKSLDAAFRVDQLLAAREERVAIRADFQVQLRLGRPGLPARAARAPHFDFVILRVNIGLHSVLPWGNSK